MGKIIFWLKKQFTTKGVHVLVGTAEIVNPDGRRRPRGSQGPTSEIGLVLKSPRARGGHLSGLQRFALAVGSEASGRQRAVVGGGQQVWAARGFTQSPPGLPQSLAT